MNYTIKKIPKSQIEITVTVPEDELLHFQEEALGDIAKSIHIEGFRLGKAPSSLVKEKISTEEVLERGIEKAVRKYYGEILEKESFDFIGTPDAKVEKNSPNLIFTITGSLLPKIILPDYSAIAKKIGKERKNVQVEEKELTEAIDWLRESRATRLTVPRPAKTGDEVEIDFEVTDNGVLIEGGSSKNHPLTIGKNMFVPGFEDELVGMKEKDQKTFSLVMPKDYKNGLGGKKLDFKVTMNLVQEKILPEVTDAFAKGLGNFTSVEGLTKSVRDGILQEKREKENHRISMKIAEEIAAEAKMDVPEILIESELDKMLAELKSGVARMGMVFENYLEHIKKTTEELRKEWRADAEKWVQIALSLRAIADKEHINPTEEEVLVKANNSLDQFKNEGHDIQKIDRMALAEYSKSIVRNQKVFEFLENLYTS